MYRGAGRGRLVGPLDRRLHHGAARGPGPEVVGKAAEGILQHFVRGRGALLDLGEIGTRGVALPQPGAIPVGGIGRQDDQGEQGLGGEGGLGPLPHHPAELAGGKAHGIEGVARQLRGDEGLQLLPHDRAVRGPQNQSLPHGLIDVE